MHMLMHQCTCTCALVKPLLLNHCMCRVDYGVRVRGFTPSRAPVVFVTMFARAGIAHAPWRMGSPPEDIGIPVAELRVAANGEGPSRREEHVELEGPGRCRFANTPPSDAPGWHNSQLHGSGGTSRGRRLRRS